MVQVTGEEALASIKAALELVRAEQKDVLRVAGEVQTVALWATSRAIAARETHKPLFGACDNCDQDTCDCILDTCGEVVAALQPGVVRGPVSNAIVAAAIRALIAWLAQQGIDDIWDVIASES